MSKQIAITTRLVTRIDNEEEIIEQAVDGLLDIGPENHMLRFTEQDQQTQVHLLVSEERAQLRRNGSFSSAMRSDAPRSAADARSHETVSYKARYRRRNIGNGV